MFVLFLHTAFAADLWDRCVEEHRATAVQAEHGRNLQRQALISPSIARGGLDRLAAEAPRCPVPHMVMAGMSHASGLDQVALSQLEKAESLARWPEVLRALAVAADAGGDDQHLEDALKMNAGDPDLRLRFIRAQSPSERTALLREAVDLHPDDLTIAETAILGLSDAGYLLEAVQLGRRLQERHPSLKALTDGLSAQFEGPPPPRKRRPSEVNVMEDGTEEVIVYSPGAARERLGKRLEDVGYTKSKSIPGGMMYQSEASMSPWVKVFDNGVVDVQASGIVTTAKTADSIRVGRSGIDLGGGSPGFTYGANRVSKKKMRARRTAVMESIWLEVTEWRQAKGRVEFQAAVLEDLPDKMSALWEQGTPIYGDDTLTSPEQKRSALLQHWATRACTYAGDAVRTEVSRFLALEVNASPTPVTPEEIAAAEKACICPDARLSLND